VGVVGVVGTITIRVNARVESVGDPAAVWAVLTLAVCGGRAGETSRGAMGAGAAIVASVGVVGTGQTTAGAGVVGAIAVRINAGI
jgi:hypothetical protein